MGLEVMKTKMKIKLYGSKSVQCKGNVQNVCIYIVKQKVETQLSGKVSEALGIITFSPEGESTVNRKLSSKDPVNEEIINIYPKVFNAVWVH